MRHCEPAVCWRHTLRLVCDAQLMPNGELIDCPRRIPGGVANGSTDPVKDGVSGD